MVNMPAVPENLSNDVSSRCASAHKEYDTMMVCAVNDSSSSCTSFFQEQFVSTFGRLLVTSAFKPGCLIFLPGICKTSNGRKIPYCFGDVMLFVSLCVVVQTSMASDLPWVGGLCM